VTQSHHRTRQIWTETRWHRHLFWSGGRFSRSDKSEKPG